MRRLRAALRPPTRDDLLASRWLRPLARRLLHPKLWAFNRRTVARGAALGIAAGFLIPLGQILFAALLAPMLRANLAVAATATLITNPFTFAPIYYAAHRFGAAVLPALPAIAHPAADMAAKAALPTMFGLTCFAVAGAALAYAAVHWGWAARAAGRRSRRRRIKTL